MKFVLPGVPAGAQPSAFMPHFNRLAGSGHQMYKGAVTGQPGTQGIAAPTINTVPSGDAGDLAQTGYHRSVDAPQTWYPNLYFERSLDGDGALGPVVPVGIYSNNMMPVPAADPRGRPARLQRPQRSGRGQTQIAQPRVIPAWGPGG